MQMGEAITVLTSATGHAIVKSFSGTDVTHQLFYIGKIFNMSEEGVSDLKSLSKLLPELENGPAQTTIRGWYQTNANQSLQDQRGCRLCHTETTPLGESCVTVQLEIVA